VVSFKQHVCPCIIPASPTCFFLTKEDLVYVAPISYTNVLVLDGVELIFFIVASMRLCFGFVLKRVLITQGCFCYRWAALTESRLFLLLTWPHQRV